jgi:orotidine-5'-phosphate decarboxylase
MNGDGGILINVSRGIIFADSGKDFAAAAEKNAADYQRQMAAYL